MPTVAWEWKVMQAETDDPAVCLQILGESWPTEVMWLILGSRASVDRLISDLTAGRDAMWPEGKPDER